LTSPPSWQDFFTDSEFCSGFKRSKKGNLWREYDGLTLTVFSKGERYSWCIASPEGPTFSHKRYGSEEDAIAGLYSELEGGN